MDDQNPIPEIRLAEPKDAPQLAAILNSAFTEDPVMTWVLGGPGRSYHLFLQLAQRLYLKHGFAHIAENAGATLWLPPGIGSDMGILDTAAAAWVVMRRCGGPGAVARGLKSSNAMNSQHPLGEHCYLFAIGVVPEFRRRGLGQRLISEGLKVADKNGWACYLEDSNPEKNGKFYKGTGFGGRGPIALPKGAPPLVGMLRPAKNIV